MSGFTATAVAFGIQIFAIAAHFGDIIPRGKTLPIFISA